MSEDFSQAYSERSFWEKLAHFAKAAGREVVEKALMLYFALIDADTPAWAKAVIVTALGYFVVPLDAIPDVAPVIGYGDDLGALAAAFGMVAMHVKPEHRRMAEEKLRVWFA